MISRLVSSAGVVVCVSLLFSLGAAKGQTPAPAPAPQAGAPATSAAPEPPAVTPVAQPPQAQMQLPPSPSKRTPGQPDYPDPRTLSIELMYWITIPGNGPDLRGGTQALDYSSVYGLGKELNSPGLAISFPISRTGTLNFEGFLLKGDSNQIAPQATAPFTTSYVKGDYLTTDYNIKTGKIYLDDLLYPHKFPVAKLRYKSILAFRYMDIQSTFNAPLSTTGEGSVTGSKQIVLPELGAAVEYALTPHLLLRAEASGFGIPHHSQVWDGAATISYRHKKWSVEGGFRALGFKTPPNKDEYFTDRIDGGFVGIRYHLQ